VEKMAKKMNKKTEAVKTAVKSQNPPPAEPTFSPNVENAFKLLLKIMSWIVGIAFIFVIILPEFNSPSLDKLTQFLFYIGIINLLVFIVIEFIKNPVKQTLRRIIHE
jgi:hypothetical protein